MRLVRFLYMIRWPHSRQRIGSRARISFVAEQSACELRRVRWRRRTCADVLHCRRAHADAGRRTSRPRRVAHRRQTVVSRWWRDQRRLKKKEARWYTPPQARCSAPRPRRVLQGAMDGLIILGSSGRPIVLSRFRHKLSAYLSLIHI